MAFKKKVQPVAKREPEVKTEDVLQEVLKRPSDQEFLNKMIDSQTEDFPSASDISLSEAYVDPFTFPKWCNQKKYAFAWANIRDDIERHRVMETGFFRIVNRSSSCIVGKPLERDFRDHGAVERQGMFLVFRPKDLDDKMRTRAVHLHGELVSSLEEGKEARGFDITHSKSKEDRGGSGLDVYAYEEPGVHAEKATDLIKPGAE